MAWQLPGQLIETCSRNMFCPCWFTLRGGGFVAGLGMEAAELAPSAGTRLADAELPAFETKSGARGAIRWNG